MKKKKRNIHGFLGAGIMFLGVFFFIIILSLLLLMGEEPERININEDSMSSRYINTTSPITEFGDEEIEIDESVEEDKQGVLEVEEERKVLQVSDELSTEQKNSLEEKYDIEFTQDSDEKGIYVINISEETDLNALEEELDTKVETDVPVKIAADSIDWGISRIGADSVWETASGVGIKIAIIDTGIQKDHPDLVNNLTTGYDFVNNDNDATDDHGHGTHVAGITSAVLNQAGTVGVSHNAVLLPIKVLNSSGYGYLSDVAKGVYYATDNGARVINLSLGAPSDYDTLRTAIQYAANKGVLIVAAAGNDYGQPCSYPAAYDNVICVMATDKSNLLASFSNIGGDISAPGVYNYSTYLGSTYKYLSGTSMASPHVAGSAALLLSLCTDCSSSDIRTLLNETAVDLGDPGKDILFGYGLVDLTSAVSNLRDEEEPTEETPIDGSPTENPDTDTNLPSKNPHSNMEQEIIITKPLPTKAKKYVPTQEEDILVEYSLYPIVENSNLERVILYLDNDEIFSSSLQEGSYTIQANLLNHSQHWIKVVASFTDGSSSSDKIIIDMTYLKALNRGSRKSILGISTSIFDWLRIF